jgi:hypothetical protein
MDGVFHIAPPFPLLYRFDGPRRVVLHHVSLTVRAEMWCLLGPYYSQNCRTTFAIRLWNVISEWLINVVVETISLLLIIILLISFIHNLLRNIICEWLTKVVAVYPSD